MRIEVAEEVCSVDRKSFGLGKLDVVAAGSSSVVAAQMAVRKHVAAAGLQSTREPLLVDDVVDRERLLHVMLVRRHVARVMEEGASCLAEAVRLVVAKTKDVTGTVEAAD
jgi:hypothetical protein